MGEKIVIGPFNKGLRNDRPPFMIDNESFPTLINAYQWRGRVKRKRGTTLLGRLKRLAPPVNQKLVLNAGQDAILSNFPIVPGTINIVGATDGTTYTDPAKNGTLVPTGGVGSGGTINYATGLIHINAGGGQTITGSFQYYPMLPVMGLEDFATTANQFPGTIGFDTTFSYNISPINPFDIYDVTFYKNPLADGVNLPGYIPKAVLTPFTWNGANYQQFWSQNYQGAMFVTNGITVPFNPTNLGMQFKLISGVAITNVGNGTTIPAVANITIVGHGLVVGDFLFINEVTGITGINFETGYVTAVLNPNTVTVTFPFAVLGGAYAGSGIAQYLTNTADPTKDPIRWYDGDPTVSSGNNGWVNFSPPLSQLAFSIGDAPAAQYYLAGARIIFNFKDRLLFIGPVIQTSSGVPIYLQDTVIFSQNGTPYYTSSFNGQPIGSLTSAATVYHPILLPVNQTSTANAWFEDTTGFGGFVMSGVDQPILSCSQNEDVLIMGFTTQQSRFVYTGNDIIPFNFFTINSELGSGSIFSAITTDSGVITRGTRGYILTSQTNAMRIDLEIPDQVFQINIPNNGSERFTAMRDFINEWIYFTYPENNDLSVFPNQTLLFNYRDNSWAIFNESYTHYGTFREATGETWLTIPYSWRGWTTPWNAGGITLFAPQVIAGNQQGFILFRETNTPEEDSSLAIISIVGSLVTSPNHGLSNGEFITIKGALGTIGPLINGLVFQVNNPTTNDFTLDPNIGAGTYLGSGLIVRMYIPLIMTKQFPVAWQDARKTRLGMQQYLLTKTPNAQIQLLIFLSQDTTTAWNDSPVIPDANVTNSALIYSTVLYTCPESTNLGLLSVNMADPLNTNLQNLTELDSTNRANNVQAQIWHRLNTSMIGDTVQVGFTLSEDQMRKLDDNGNLISQMAEIELNGIILDVSPAGYLS